MNFLLLLCLALKLFAGLCSLSLIKLRFPPGVSIATVLKGQLS